jgi:hypothetical protein
MLPFALPMFLVPRLGAKLTWPARSILSLGLCITVGGNVLMALLSDGGASYAEFAVAMIIAGTGAGILNGETAKAVQGALPANRSGVASGIASTIRFTTLLFGVAALGAILVTTMLKTFVPLAHEFALSAADAAAIAKSFSAGDAASALLKLPVDTRGAVANTLRLAFESGFGGVAWTAAGVAVVSLILTRLLMSHTPALAATEQVAEALFVADE